MTYNLKSEKDVREYLDNLHTEYSFGCYGERNPEVCHLLGEFYDNCELNSKKSTEIYKKNCDNMKYGRSCSKLARFYVTGDGVGERNLKTAYKYFKRGCELDDSTGCFYAALMIYSKEDIGVPDKKTVYDEGLKMLNKACNDLNEIRACEYLSAIYTNGLSGIVKQNLPMAFKMSLKCCEKGIPTACSNVARMYARGEGTEKDETLALTFRKKAIELEQDVMNNVGVQFQQGINP